MRRIIILNSKGGCGKTTVAINLASLYASRGLATALFDHDPQGCSKCWLDQRPPERPAIHGIAAYAKTKSSLTRSWQMRVPADVERIIIDTPAGLDKPDLLEHVRGVDAILVPIVPSAIDMRAAASFLDELLGANRTCRARIGIIANRIPDDSLNVQALMRFTEALQLPVVAEVRASPLYLQAADLGLGVHEIDHGEATQAHKTWSELVDWIEANSAIAAPASQIVNA